MICGSVKTEIHEKYHAVRIVREGIAFYNDTLI